MSRIDYDGNGKPVRCTFDNDESVFVNEIVKHHEAEITRLQSDLATCEQEARQMRARNERLEAEIATFCMEYRMKTDEQLKAAHVEIAALKAELLQTKQRLQGATENVGRFRDEAAALKDELAEVQSLIRFLNEHCDAAWDLVDADQEQIDRIKKLVTPAGITPFNPLNAASNTHPAPADKDAERYRWLLNHGKPDLWHRCAWSNSYDDAESFIDAAIAKEGK
jgi:predicted RNase H-like nuclease (RuvC/YqgF family)